jgi:hypothetical protein
VGVLAGLILTGLLVALSARWMRDVAQRSGDEERDFVWADALPRQGLRELFEQGRQRLMEAVGGLRRARVPRLFAALSIRRIYAYLGALADAHGYPRPVHQTPYDYLPTLDHAFPNNAEDVRRITDAYVSVHYGEAPERPPALAEVRAAWERIRQAGLRQFDKTPHP